MTAAVKMSFLVLFLFSLVMTNNTTDQYYIIDCHPCIMSEYPHLVSLYQNVSKISCTGVLIDLNWILTTAKCVNRTEIKSKQYFALAGNAVSLESHLKLKGKFPEDTRTVHNGFTHYFFKNHTHDLYDVGVLKLEKPFRNNSLQRLYYAPTLDEDELCLNYRTAAWGAFDPRHDSKHVEHLENEQIDVRKGTTSKKTTSKTITKTTTKKPMTTEKATPLDSMFHCTALVKDKSAHCKKFGDSFPDKGYCTMANDQFDQFCGNRSYGGPVLCNQYIVGIFNSRSCEFPDRVGLVMKLETYRDFVEKVVGFDITFDKGWQEKARKAAGGGPAKRASLWTLAFVGMFEVLRTWSDLFCILT